MINRYKRFSWQNRKLSILLVLGSAFGQLAASSTALASLPGESSGWTEETAGGGEFETLGAIGEARQQDGTLLRAWRSTNNQVTFSINGESPFVLGSTLTSYTPVVVPLYNDRFLVFHTGTDARIWYTTVYTSRGWSGIWTAIPEQTTIQQVSAVQMGPGSGQVYLVYQGVGDQNVWGMTYDGVGWRGPEWIAEGRTLSGPSVTYNPTSPQHLWVAVRGEDSAVWLSRGNPGSWYSWTNEELGPTRESPTLVTDDAGNVVLAYVNTDQHPTYAIFNSAGTRAIGPSQDRSGWSTMYSLSLILHRGVIYALLAGLNFHPYFKPLTR